VPEFDTTVDSSNVYDITEANTRVPYQPAGDRKEFVALLADNVLQRVLHPQSDQWSPLVDLVQKLGDEKDLMLFSYDAKQEQLVQQFGWDGGVSYSSGDFLQVVDASVNSTKLNEVIEHSANVDVKLDASGAAATTVTLDYFNDLTPWEQGKDPQLVQKLMLGGMYGGYTRLFTPPGTKMLSVRDAQGEIGVEEVTREQGLAVFGRFFALPRDTRQQLIFNYVTPPLLVRQGNGWTYQLNLKRQPGWELPLTLRIEPPPGMKEAAVQLDGQPFASNSVDMKIDLSQDRVVTVRFTRLMLTAAAIGIASAILGLYLSYWLDVASGATIVLVQTVWFAATLALGPRGLIARRRGRVQGDMETDADDGATVVVSGGAG